MKAPTMCKERIIARAVIHGAKEMTHAERVEVADWLNELALDVVAQGDRYAARMTATRYGRKR